MRVGIFSESYPPIVNGVSTSVRTLMTELETAGHHVFIFTSQAKPDAHYQEDHANVYRYPSIPSLVEPQYQLPVPFSRTIKTAIPKLGLDIIHSQSPFFLGLIARHVARTLRLPLVSTNHTIYTEYVHYLPGISPQFSRGLLTGWMRTYYNSCDYVLVPSDFTRKTLLELGVRSPLMVMPTGIPLPTISLLMPEKVRSEWGIPLEAQLLLYAGRLAPEKNLGLLLDAFVQIQSQMNTVHLILAGSGMGEAATREMVKQRGIEEKVTFTGFLKREQLDPLYAAADIFLFSSKTETQGLAVGEAMACGAPCVVVNAGGAPESVQHGVNGFLVEDDPSEMAKHALKILKDPLLRAALSHEALAHAAERTPEKVAGRMIGLYQELLERGAKGKQHQIMEATA
jgi:1,2-diacylglycerol 3-alpha-glucosyltransferase